MTNEIDFTSFEAHMYMFDSLSCMQVGVFVQTPVAPDFSWNINNFCFCFIAGNNNYLGT